MHVLYIYIYIYIYICIVVLMYICRLCVDVCGCEWVGFVGVCA
jgi:hypothetical protein